MRVADVLNDAPLAISAFQRRIVNLTAVHLSIFARYDAVLIDRFVILVRHAKIKPLPKHVLRIQEAGKHKVSIR